MVFVADEIVGQGRRTRCCLAVNAAFLQEIKEDNSFLGELLLSIQTTLASCHTEVNVPALVELLRRLRDRVGMHFSREEAFGYCEDAVNFPTQLSGRQTTRERQTCLGLRADDRSHTLRLVERHAT